MNAYAIGLANKFRSLFDKEPILYFSPGRINLIGEHIDYNDGFVMPAAISKGIYIAFARNNTRQCNFYANDMDQSCSVMLDAVHKQDGWKNYVLSVLNEFISTGVNAVGFDCAFGGDVPQGSGLSSSAALEGALACALNDCFDTGFDRMALALLCQRAEHNFPAVHCGIMDQFANMMGREHEVILLDCMDLRYEYLPLITGDYTILLINSMVHHTLAAAEYNLRRDECAQGLHILRPLLAVNSFRDISCVEDMLPYRDQVPEKVFDRCCYVVAEIARVKAAAKYLRQEDLQKVGTLMYETHRGLSKLYEVSCEELDFLVDHAAGNPAVIGARLMGGGFGGCTINILQTKAAAAFTKEISASYHKRFGKRPEIYPVETASGVTRITL